MRKSHLFALCGLGLIATAAVAYSLGLSAAALLSLGSGVALALTIPPSYSARGDYDQRVHHIRVRVQFANVGAFTAGRKVARLPSRAFVHSIAIHTSVAFNSGTSDSVQLGTSAAGVDILAATSIHATGYAAQAAAAGLGLAVTGSGEADVWVRYTQSGAAASAGDATVIIAYVPDNDQ